MTSKSEAILSAVATALNSTTGVAGVYRDRWEAVSREEMPALVVQPLSEDPRVIAIPNSESELTFTVDILINGAPLSTLADPVRVSVHALLTADRTLGGLAQDVLAGPTNWDAESGEIGTVSMIYRATFRHLTTDLTQ